MNFRQPIRALFSDVGSLYALDDRAWKKLGNGKISLIHNAYNPTKVLLSLETDINEYVYQMKPKTKKKGQTWILKGDNTKTNSSDILAVRFSDKHISSYFKKMLEKAAKLKKKHEQRHRRHPPHPNVNHGDGGGPNNGAHHHGHRRHGHHPAGDDRDALPPISKSEIFKPIYTISWRCPLCKYMNEIGSYKCNVCLTPQSDLHIINSTQDQFVEIVNIIQSALHNNHDRQHKLLNDLISLTKKLMKNDHAHKSLDLNNRDIQQNLLSVRGVDQFLSCLGFVEDAPKKKLKCPEDKPHIYAVIAAQSVCKQCINQDAVRQIDEKKKENEGEIGLNKTRILNECNGDIEYCMSVRRVIYVLKYYHEFVWLKGAHKSTRREGGIYDYLYVNNDEDIQFYSNSLLLNDMIHILLEHDNNGQFEELYAFTVKELGGKACDIGTCQIVLRNHRDRSVCAENRERVELYFGFNGAKEVNTQQIIDKLHCFIMHSFDMGYKLRQTEQNKVNEERLNIGKLYSILKAKKKENVKYIKCGQYNRFIMHRQSDLDMDNEEKGNEDVVAVHNVNGNVACFYEKKYRDLKEEMLQNKGCKISNEQWMDLWQKANDFLGCETLINITLQTSVGNEHYMDDDYKQNDDICMEIYHLISVLLYCNFERLCYEFRCTLQLNADNNVNKYEFANWWQILRETVDRYGMKMKSNDNNKLYYGVNGEILFTDFALSFAGTLSVSSEYVIPYLYTNTDTNGLLLECSDNGMSYFVCDFLSDFMYEKEKLFLSHDNVGRSIEIKNIYNMLLKHDYKYCINAIQIILKMVDGKALNTPIGENVQQILVKCFKTEKEKEKNGNIYNKDDDKKDDNENVSDYYCNDIYFKQMMEFHCNKITEIEINLFLMNINSHEINCKLCGYLPLKSLFLAPLYDNAWIQLNIFCNIFKNLQKIYIYNVNVSILASKQKQQKTMNLSKKFLDNLWIFLSSKSTEIALNEIVTSNVNESTLSIQEAIKIYKKEFVAINWTICCDNIKKGNNNYKQLIFKRNRMNFNKAKLKQILYEIEKEIYELSIIFEDNESESISISKSYGDFYNLYDELLNKMNIKFDVVLETNNIICKDLTNDLSRFYQELLIKCKNNTNDSLLLSKVYNFLIV